MRSIIAAAALLFVFARLAAASGEEPLRFAQIRPLSANVISRAWEPLFADLGEYLGREVRAKVYEDYAGVIRALGSGEADAAWMGNMAAIQAVDRGYGEIGASIVGLHGEDGYYALLLVRSDSPLWSVDDVIRRAGSLVFGNGDPNSTSGSLVPGYYVFTARGLDPQRIFLRMTRDNHEGNFLAVADGKVDVATGNSASLAGFKERYPRRYGKVRIIWTSPRIPSDPILWRRNLPLPTKDKLREFFVGYGKPAPGKSAGRLEHERETLAGIRKSGFAASDDSQLAPLRVLERRQEEDGAAQRGQAGRKTGAAAF